MNTPLPQSVSLPFVFQITINVGTAHCISKLSYIILTFVGSDWVDPNDPTVIAEAQLLGAASNIEAAARRLAELQPRRLPKVQYAVLDVHSMK